ncbi:TonB-dependent receptor [Pedobacter soli]|uniref:Iron complex outermembrane recepter protein n=1 Tax=Pedobacter soli TaxID=390242 RepID=A0A1G6XE54_9SPHI|nr:TonB-dependent receptor [Pedobacter soli]SDD76524.1 iron complex outermembrane recepter protein [Pedobacter soli]
MKLNLILLLSLISFTSLAQTLKPDTSQKLKEITVKGYYNHQPLLRSVSAVSLIDSNLIKNQSANSLASTLNTVTGVRMEERSPGSYRLSLRGSLLRSPFGIRNIKIYVDDFPLTDAGGNTYLNALDVTAVGNMEIYKGPDASIFGANTGGALLITPPDIKSNEINAAVQAGSYGLFHQTAAIQHRFKNYSFSISEGYQKSTGFRQNSALNRKYIQTQQQWDYNAFGSLKAFIFYSDLNYKTPGGLTAAQLEQDPQLARPATPTLPGAITQQAAIYNKTVFGGLSNTYQITPGLKHVIALFATYTDFKNPFITNYEQRYESTLGLRTFLGYDKVKEHFKFGAQIGLESSGTKSEIKNFNNNAGEPAAMQASDRLKANQNFAYLRLNFDLYNKLLIELASSLNFFNYNYESYFPVAIATKSRKFDPQFMPKLALSYLISKSLSARASVSKGYSPPTIAEVRSSDNNINNDLQAERGWNYELGLRYQTKNNRFYANGNIFSYRLQDAIVRRLNQNDAEYFINAGGTKQQGIELETAIWIIKNQTSFLSGLQLRSNYTFSHFRFENFISGTSDYSNNKLTGVPEHVLINSLELNFPKAFYLFVQHNYTSAIPLNDANTVFAKRYHLIEAKAGIRNLKVGKTHFEVFGGVNNLLNVKYSLGNDLNAANGRYFNPAAGINFYTGLSVKL